MIDLHTHTTASDGVINPRDLVQKAKEVGLSAIAITDHDQVGGLAEGLAAGKDLEMEVIPGVEISTYWKEKNRKEFHILGYFIDWQNPKLTEKLNFYQNERIRVAKECLKKLNTIGYAADWADVLKIAQGSVGKPHLCRVCFANPANKDLLIKVFGKMPEVNDFVRYYMLPGQAAYVEKAGMEPKEAIDLIHEAGGVAVLAHPCFDVPEGQEIIKIMKEWGIEGLEALAPFKTPEATRESIKIFSKMAKENNLLITGGSDYHGLEGIGAGLGFIEWGMEIPDEVLVDLKNYKLR